jgi:hypothetical protein
MSSEEKETVVTIDILVSLDGEHCQVKFSMFGEKKRRPFMKGNVLY